MASKISGWMNFSQSNKRTTGVALLLQNDGILVKILAYLEDSDLKRYRLVSRRWNRVINQYNKSHIDNNTITLKTSQSSESKEEVEEESKAVGEHDEAKVEEKAVPVVKQKPDLLSGCSSLALILSFVNKSDILKFKLINRGFYNVIRQNQHQLVRYPTRCSLGFSSSTHDIEHVTLSFRNTVTVMGDSREVGCSMCVTHHRLMIGECKWMRSPKEYIGDNATLVDDRMLPDQDIFEDRPSFKDLVGYRIDSMEQGLALAMSSVLRTYYLETLCMQLSLMTECYLIKTFSRIDPNYPQYPQSTLSADHLSAISSAFTREESSCDRLQINTVVPGISRFYKLLGCQRVLFTDYSLVSRMVPLLTEFNCEIKLGAQLNEFDSWEPYVALIKKWSGSRMRIKNFEMRPSYYAGEEWSYQPTAQELMSCLQGIDCFHITHLRYSSELTDKELVILIGRDTDNVVLQLNYAKQYCMLTMQDYLMYRRL